VEGSLGWDLIEKCIGEINLYLIIIRRGKPREIIC
jgi:hypothetical protein